MQAKMCDRCGIFYIVGNKATTDICIPYPERGEYITYDLCEKCTYTLREWMDLKEGDKAD